MKIYKINGKEIGEFDVNELNHDYTANKFNELLEALIEKKEEGEICTCDIYCHNGVNMNNCVYKPHHVNKEEAKQEDCGACDYEGKHNRKITPSRHTCTPEQSTSLKEVPLKDKIDFIQDRLLNDHVTTEESITEILEVVQSHIVKEIESYQKPPRYGEIDKKSGMQAVFPQIITLEDIIKIINTLTK